MKKFAILLTVATATLMVKAQQVPLYSAYYFNQFLLNPAFTGINNDYRAFLFYRDQWTGYPNGPVTRGGTAEGSFWKNRSGVGVDVINDNTDIIQRVSAHINYAQKIHVGKNHVIALGVGIGLMDTRVRFNEAHPHDNDDNYLLVNSGRRAAFDLNAGIAYQWKKLRIGFAMPQILNTSARITSQLKESKFQLTRHITASASYEINIAKEKFNITPMVFVRKGNSAPVQVDASLMLDYKHMVFLGASYRTEYGVSAIAGVDLFKHVTIAYAYDFNMNNKIKSYVGGSHEVILGVHFGNADGSSKKLRDSQIRIDSLMYQNNEANLRNEQLRRQLDKAKKDNEAMRAENEKARKLLAENDSLSKLLSEVAKDRDDFRNGKLVGTKSYIGKHYVLNNIFFDLDKSELLPESKKQLDQLVTLLNERKNWHIEIEGNTDDIASEQYNQLLSERRAKAVYEYLIQNGINARRLSYVGYGKRYPVADNTTDEGRQKNRRVEFKVVKE
ncbi:MAG: PorP/SprF family type IX secretion system membrane protein [Chitinophagales bacterium]